MFDLKSFRNSLGLTQSEMAEKMGMPFRSYQDIETGKSPVRRVHVAAARYARWQMREETRSEQTTLPLQFFLVRFLNPSGQWSSPWTVWAEDYPQAVGRFYNLATVDETIAVDIRVSHDYPSRVEFPHSIDNAAAVLEHTGKQWPY